MWRRQRQCGGHRTRADACHHVCTTSGHWSQSRGDPRRWRAAGAPGSSPPQATAGRPCGEPDQAPSEAWIAFVTAAGEGGESLARAGPGVRRKTLPPEGTRAGNAPAAAAWLASATSKMGAEQGGDVGRVSRAPRAGRAPRGRSGDTGRPSPDRKRDLAVTEKLRVPPWLLKQSSESVLCLHAGKRPVLPDTRSPCRAHRVLCSHGSPRPPPDPADTLRKGRSTSLVLR